MSIYKTSHVHCKNNLEEVMSRQVVVAMSDQKLAEIDVVFATQFGMPVLDNKERCIGVSAPTLPHLHYS